NAAVERREASALRYWARDASPGCLSRAAFGTHRCGVPHQRLPAHHPLLFEGKKEAPPGALPGRKTGPPGGVALAESRCFVGWAKARDARCIRSNKIAGAPCPRGLALRRGPRGHVSQELAFAHPTRCCLTGEYRSNVARMERRLLQPARHPGIGRRGRSRMSLGRASRAPDLIRATNRCLTGEYEPCPARCAPCRLPLHPGPA